MNKINVELVVQPDFATTPEGLIGGLAKITMHKKKFKAWKQQDKARKLVKKLMRMDHTSLLESIDLGVIIHGASRVFLSQITRHRMAMYMSGSQQYQLHLDFDYVIPEVIAKDPMAKDLFESTMVNINDRYKQLESMVGRDAARYVLPGACRNQIFMKANIRSWQNVFEQRICTRNTPETVDIMKQIRSLFIKEGYGVFFEKQGLPTCVFGTCNQGTMTCGVPLEVEDLHG